MEKKQVQNRFCEMSLGVCTYRTVSIIRSYYREDTSLNQYIRSYYLSVLVQLGTDTLHTIQIQKQTKKEK